MSLPIKRKTSTSKNSTSSKKPKFATSFPKYKSLTNPRRGTGVQSERLLNDGQTFTLEMAMPASKIAGESKTYTICQSSTAAAYVTTSTSTPTFATALFVATNIDQWNTLASVWDQYRILELEYWLVPQVSDAVSAASGQLYTVIDLDDNTNLTSIGQAQDYSNCVFTECKTGHYRHFIPHVADALYAGAFTSYGNVASPWIDCASGGVYHYGIKIAVSNTSQSIIYDLFSRAKFQFRNVR